MKSGSLILCAMLLGLPIAARADFRALIIGVDSYSERDSSFAPLRGVRDAMNFEAILKSTWRAGNPRIKRLWDRDATRENIVDAIDNWLLKGAKKSDTLVLYFSGHGTTVPADLATGIRSALVPYDVKKSAMGKGLDEHTLITGKFLHEKLVALENAHFRNVTLIVDACQSGGMRKPGPVAKAIFNDAPGVTVGVPDGGGPMFDRVEGLSEYVVISAAGATEWAWQGDNGGYLTLALQKAVDGFERERPGNGRPITYLDLRDRVLNEMDNLAQHGTPQHPFLKGRLNRPMFGVGTVANDPYYTVRVEHRTGGQPVVRIGAGILNGVDRSTRFAIYPAGTFKFGRATPIAYAKVLSVDACDCVVIPDRMGGRHSKLDSGQALIIGDSDMRKYRVVSNLESPNSRIRIEVVPIQLPPPGARISSAKPLGPVVPKGQFFTFKIRASDPRGKKIESSHNFAFVQLLGCPMSGKVLPLWPQAATSSDDSRLVADGKWRYLGQDGGLVNDVRSDHIAFWKMESDSTSHQEVFKFIGTNKAIPYDPMVVSRRQIPAPVRPIATVEPVLSPRPVFRSGSKPAKLSDLSVGTAVLRTQQP